EGDGLLPALVNDTELRDRFASTLDHLDASTAELNQLIEELASSDGLLSRLMKDEALADELLADVRGLLDQLNRASEKLNRGEGTVSRLLNDPSVYEAISDILVGVNESRMLRWLLRNRQRAGVRQRYEEAQSEAGGEQETDPPRRESPPVP
ncbi:MAG TPA: hypothetical protein VMS86_04975, partial [Thermoanaerobaculia bacterium]|nr:hypothetical protein [Thermoanaerobaculia bacterium]